MSQDINVLYAFGDFRLDPCERFLRRGDACVHLTPKAFDLLVLLVEAPARLLSRQHLIDALWPDSVVEEHGLTWNISALRRALGDDGETPHYIETVRGYGYRFIAPVQRMPIESRGPSRASTAAPPDATDRGPRVMRQTLPSTDTSPPRESRRASRAVHATWLSGVGILAVVLVWVGIRLLTGPTAAPRAGDTPPGRPVIAVMGFRNLSANHDLDWIGDAFSEMLGTELASGGKIRITPAADVLQARRNVGADNDPAFTPAQLDRMRHTLGAEVIVAGAYLQQDQPTPQRIRVDVRMRLQRSDGHVSEWTGSATGDDLFKLVTTLGRQMRGQLGLQDLNPAQRSELMASMPSGSDAAADYASGRSALAAGNALLARTLLTRSIRQDPDFPLAHSALAQAWLDLGDDRNADAEARLALRHSAGLSYTQRQLLLGLRAEAKHQWSQATEAYRRLFNANPDSLNYGLMLARALDKASDFKQAQSILAELYKLPPPFGNDPRVMMTDSKIRSDLDENQASYEAAMHAAARASALGQDTVQARSITDAAHALIKQGDFSGALELAERGRKLFIASDADSIDAGTNLQIVGMAHHELGQYDQALDAYEDANELFARIGNQYRQAVSLNDIGAVYYCRDQMTEARQSYLRALLLFRGLHRDSDVARVLSNLAMAVGNLGDLDQALDYARQSMTLARAIGRPREVALALFSQGQDSYALGHFDDAEKYLREARDIYLEQHASSAASNAISGLADLAYARNRLEDARKGYEKALVMRRKEHVPTSVAWSQRDLAELDLETGHPVRALQRVTAALPVFVKAHMQSDAIITRADMALALERLGRLDSARKQIRILDAQMQTLSSQRTLLGLKITRAILARGLGNTTHAARLLTETVRQARNLKMKLHVYPARLELARLHARHGIDATTREQIQTLADDAQRDGFLYVTVRARRLLTRGRTMAMTRSTHDI